MRAHTPSAYRLALSIVRSPADAETCTISTATPTVVGLWKVVFTISWETTADHPAGSDSWWTYVGKDRQIDYLEPDPNNVFPPPNANDNP